MEKKINKRKFIEKQDLSGKVTFHDFLCQVIFSVLRKKRATNIFFTGLNLPKEITNVQPTFYNDK